ncbi:hypothetical protein K4S66_05100 [Staphylococcus epidermidis]|nr:hypothetical protein [Staphylococcus epidermidis]
MNENFTERQHEKEKNEAVKYVSGLIKSAKEKNQTTDVLQLEEVLRLLNTKKYGLVWEKHTEKIEEEIRKKVLLQSKKI